MESFKIRILVILFHMASGDIASRWRALSGENGWEGLLDPIDDDLRRYIVHYGERVQAVNDAIILDTKSENYALPLYGPGELFCEVGLIKGRPFKYDVKKYLYGSTSFVNASAPVGMAAGNSRWLGYVAVATDEGKEALGRRDILVTIRGTIFDDASREDAIDTWWLGSTTSASKILGDQFNPQVHNGWYLYYTTSEAGSTYNVASFRDQLLSTLRELVDQYKDEDVSITLTGHSMGAAMATLAATDIVTNAYNKPSASPDNAFPVTAFVLASPHIGDQGFKDAFDALHNLHVLRVENNNDRVPDLPPELLGYTHVGTRLPINSSQSNYLKEPTGNLHELEIYLHGVAGFDPEIRDIAVINKQLDALKDENGIPAKWWNDRDELMVQLINGNWAPKNHQEDDEWKLKSS